MGWFVNNELGRMWEEVSQVPSRYLPGGTEKDHETASQDIRRPGRYFNPGRLEYKEPSCLLGI